MSNAQPQNYRVHRHYDSRTIPPVTVTGVTSASIDDSGAAWLECADGSVHRYEGATALVALTPERHIAELEDELAAVKRDRDDWKEACRNARVTFVKSEPAKQGWWRK